MISLIEPQSKMHQIQYHNKIKINKNKAAKNVKAYSHSKTLSAFKLPKQSSNRKILLYLNKKKISGIIYRNQSSRQKISKIKLITHTNYSL
jgi:hypothetical protein